jgi:2-hydroxycyclohexanecarboxyl-CoA dehydrogenase
MHDFSGQVAVVTGGSSGIGAAVARQLAGRGAKVVVWDVSRDPSPGQERIELHRVDVSSLDEVMRAAEDVLERHGGCHVLVNNAGTDIVEPFMESDPVHWRALIDVNLFGVLNCCRALLPALIRAQGSIVNVASDAGRVGSSNEAVYSAAKGGVIAFSKALAREMARHGVRVNCVAPGPTATPLLERAASSSPHLIEALVRAIPLRRPAHPEEVASAIVFLASSGASFITGQTLSVSGGLTMI